jgi:hypothetical protein
VAGGHVVVQGVPEAAQGGVRDRGRLGLRHAQRLRERADQPLGPVLGFDLRGS